MTKKCFLFSIFVSLVCFSTLFAMEKRKRNPDLNALERGETEKKRRNKNVISKKAKEKIKKDTCSCSECTSICLCGALGCAWGMWMVSDPEVVKNNILDDTATNVLVPYFSSLLGAAVGKIGHALFDKNKKKN